MSDLLDEKRWLITNWNLYISKWINNWVISCVNIESFTEDRFYSTVPEIDNMNYMLY